MGEAPGVLPQPHSRHSRRRFKPPSPYLAGLPAAGWLSSSTGFMIPKPMAEHRPHELLKGGLPAAWSTPLPYAGHRPAWRPDPTYRRLRGRQQWGGWSCCPSKHAPECLLLFPLDHPELLQAPRLHVAIYGVSDELP
jgi:hypothetical protein